MFHTVAFNDVVVNKGELGRMIEFDVLIDGEFVYTQRSDGIIVLADRFDRLRAFRERPHSSPARGRHRAGASLPACAHRAADHLAQRVFDRDRRRPAARRTGYPDGQTRFDAGRGSGPRRALAAHRHALHPEGYSYFDMLREKLHWSSSPPILSARQPCCVVFKSVIS